MSDLKITEPGIYPGIPLDAYHGDICDSPSLSSSGMKTLINACPAKFWATCPANPHAVVPEDDTAAQSFGGALHDLVLLGEDALLKGHLIIPDDVNLNSKEGRALKAQAEDEGKDILRAAKLEDMRSIRDEIHNHPLVHTALSDGIAEASMFACDPETGVWLKSRPDFLPDARDFMPDLKSMISSNPEDFGRQALNFGYHMQQAHYEDVFELVTGEPLQGFFFIVVEKKPPYVTTPIALDRDAVDWGRKLNRKAIQLFAHGLETGKWPGYADGIATSYLPHWAVKDLEFKEETGFFDNPMNKEKSDDATADANPVPAI